jgi:hypothetical protein
MGLRLPEFIDNWHMKMVTLSALRASGFETTTFHLVDQCLNQPRHLLPPLLSELFLVLTCAFLKHLYVSKTAVIISTATLPISNVPALISKSCTGRISKAYAYLNQLHVSPKRVSKTSDPIVDKCKYLYVVALMFRSRTEFFLSSTS